MSSTDKTQERSLPAHDPSAPRVTIGLPVYNGDAFLAAAIDSLLAQTYRDFELIISDNASTDGTEAICRDRAARDPRIRYYRSAKNRGAMWNFNYVVELARGEYFKWAAHDDVHEPTYVERCVEVLDRDPGVVLACTKLVDIDENNVRKPVEVPDLAWDAARPNVRFRALANPHHRCESVFGVIRASVLRKTMLISDYAGCDRVLLSQIALAGRFHEVPRCSFSTASTRNVRPSNSRTCRRAARGSTRRARTNPTHRTCACSRVTQEWSPRRMCRLQTSSCAWPCLCRGRSAIVPACGRISISRSLTR
jgi:glycosyltransferase involved in cell wall biosynthesis